MIDEPHRGAIGDLRWFQRSGIETIREMITGNLPGPPPSRLIGLRPTDVGPGRVTFSMPVSPWLEDAPGPIVASPSHRDRSRTFAEAVVTSQTVIPDDLGIAREHAFLLTSGKRAGRPRGAHDLLIAATARATQRAFVTADGNAFDDLPGVEVRSHREESNST